MNTIIDAEKSSFFGNLNELWDYRELLLFLTWRQIIVRYKQTVIGMTWALLQPLLSTIIMTVVLNAFLDISSGDIPYPIFILTGLIHWKYFSDALTQSGQSLVQNTHLISKVYFPRLIIPISSSLSPLVDYALSFFILLAAMPIFGVTPTWQIIFVPLLVAFSFFTALSVSLWLAALNVRFRDTNYVIPFLIQIWMYLTPIIYPVETVPEKLRALYSVNPMVGVVQGARWALLGTENPDFTAIAIGIAGVAILLMGGIVFFNRMERSFADVI
jgi:lipopolysaccharide transport system permease protein